MKKSTATLAVLMALAGCSKKSNDNQNAPAAKPTTEPTTAPAPATPTAPAPTAEAKPLALDTPLTAGNGVTLAFSKKQTNAGGDNQPPTMKHSVIAKCGGKDVVVIEREDEGGDAKVTVALPAGSAVVTMNVHIAREGENTDEVDTATLDLASCQVAKK